MSRLVLAGAGGFGREVFSWAHATAGPDGPWRDVVFIDDSPEALAATRFPAVRIASVTEYRPADGDRVAISVGQPDAKMRIHASLAARGVSFQTLVHPSAVVGATCEVGEGCIVCPGSIVTANAQLGRFVTLNVYATVGHDAVVSDYSTVGGHADVTGGACLGEGVFLGSHAVVAPRVHVGAFAVIGAGSVALRNVGDRTTVLGVPGDNLGVFSKPRRR